jgi:FKBP-type peptidyl-prolyl cis-trans isomerase FkpA
MNKFKYYFVLLLAGIAVVSCNKSDDDEVVTVPLRDYAVQYKADNDSIEKYLKTNYIEVDETTFDVKITKIPAGGAQVSIWDQKTYPLESRDVYSHDVTYKVYYLTLRKGTKEAPCSVDRISASYTGTLLNGTQFDTSYNLARTFDLNVHSTSPTVDGWSEIIPKFNTGTSNIGADGVISYDGFGAGVMFLPSGLGYYANAQGEIPSYSPIVFSFKLYQLQRTDSDFDGIADVDEDINHDGYLYDVRDTARYPKPPESWGIDDTDKDGVADFMDIDDDGDGYATLFEVTKPTGAPFSGVSKYYPYSPTLDNPDTPNVDESEIWGIPRRPTGELTDPAKPESIDNPRKFISEDYTEPTRLRIHLDKTYPYQKK